MASQDLMVVEQPPALQPVQSPVQEKQPTLVEGSFQSCEGHIERRTKILKRWKKEYIKVIPGTQIKNTRYIHNKGRGYLAGHQKKIGCNLSQPVCNAGVLINAWPTQLTPIFRYCLFNI